MGLTMKEWWGLSVEPYALRKEVESSSVEMARFWESAMQVKSNPLCTIHTLVLSGYSITNSNWTDQRHESKRGTYMGSYLTNQTSPSVAVCFFVFNSLTTNSCNVSPSAGAANWRSLIFFTFPNISFLTGVKATEPSTSNNVVRDSAASRKGVVEMALSFSASMGTSVKDFLSVSRKVPPVG